MPKLLRTPNANICRRFAATAAPSAPPIFARGLLG